jgi:ParB-like chromosome segregation protein Spo0J
MPDEPAVHSVVQVEIDSLLEGGSPRTSGESHEHVELLAGAEQELPPIVVHRSTMRVIDGTHRLRAARLRGERTIAVRFYDGSEGDAFVLAVKLNIAHGLPLSLADRKRAAGRIIGSHPRWSDRMIASVAGISAKTVAEMRGRMEPDAARDLPRIGKDGRVRSVDGTMGRKVAYDLITRNPGLSLRQIAREAGISPETARDVRNRLNRGEGPLPGGRSKEMQEAGHVKTRQLGLFGEFDPRRTQVRPPAVIVERLKADPALRFNESGRDLLRLLTIHSIPAEDLSKIMDSVPPHCQGIVAQLARDCAEVWTEFAMRMEGTRIEPG